MIGNIIIGGLLVLAVAFIVYRMIKNRGKGCSSCSGCSAQGVCPSSQIKNETDLSE